MAESASPPENDQPKQHKSFGKSKWRGKLFANESIFIKSVNDQESNDEDVNRFLQGSSQKPGVTSIKTVQAPRIETANASRWPSTSGDHNHAASENIYRNTKSRRSKGLQVSFVTSAPDIIGEGGDEAEAPPIYVSQQYESAADITSFLQLSLQPAPTGRSETAKDRLEDNPLGSKGTEGPTVSLSPLEIHQFLPHPHRDAGDFYPDQKSSDEDRSVSSESTYSDSDEVDATKYTSSFVQSSSLLKPPTSSNMTIAGNSLTPRTSPEPTPDLPSASSLERGYLDTPKTAQVPPSRTPQPSSSNVQQETPIPPSDVKPKTLSLRDIAKSVGVDALDEFHMRVRRFHEIFRLGIAVHQDTMEISLSRWIRAALWWFLKGRRELESAVRNRPRSAASQEYSESTDIGADLKQAYLDLAKAWWIVRDITPNHPDIRRFGNASMQSIVPIIQNFGDHNLANLVQTHLSLLANMRALAMSMKRNGRLPPDTIELQRLEARVLFEPAALPPDLVAALFPFSSQHKRGGDSPSTPLGDTDYHFAFSRTFGLGSLTARSRSWDTIHTPCMVTMLRSKDSLDLSALISSQDGGIDIMVRSEKTKMGGLRWKDVRWRASVIHVNISDSFDLSIQMTDSDFKAVWDIYDYTRKVQKDSQGREGEELAFECRLEDFQCLQSTRHPSSFPKIPVKGCRARLFTKTTLLSDGSNHRRIHAGHRLMVTTSPQSKLLNSVSQVYGDGTPSIFGFGRREDEPKLALQVPNSSQLLLTFKSWEDLDLLYNTFTQRKISGDEDRSASLALQEFNITLVPSEDQPPNQGALHLPDHCWHQVKVISRRTGEDNQYCTPTERSQSLRIIAQCEQGILTDHINLGEHKLQPPSARMLRLTHTAPGELQISLGVNNCNEIRLLRPLQRDLALALTDNGLADQMFETWRDVLWNTGRSANIKSYHFRSLSGAATFYYAHSL